MIFNKNIVINSNHYNPFYFHLCITLAGWKYYFTKAHATTVIRSILGNSHCIEPSQAQRQACSRWSKRWSDVDCIINNLYFYFLFLILLLLWIILEQKPVKRVAVCEISINPYFSTCLFVYLFIYFLILQSLMFI